MADTELVDLAAAGSVAGTDLVYVVTDPGGTPTDNKATVATLLAGVQPLDADLTALAAAGNSAVLAATTASFTTADESKLDGIEALADVTDATNVAAAGAVMESDTSTAAMAFVVDEDNMASNSATKVPTQQSVKAYVDANSGGGGGGLPLVSPTTASNTKTYVPLPGYPVLARDVPVGIIAGTWRYLPMRLDAAWTIEEVAIHVATASGTAGAKCYAWCYEDPGAEVQPGDLVLDATGGVGGFAVDATGAKAATGLATTLQPGHYVWVVGSPTGSGNFTLTGHRIAMPWLSNAVNNQWFQRFELSSQSATTPPDPGSEWSAGGNNNNAFETCLFLKGSPA